MFMESDTSHRAWSVGGETPFQHVSIRVILIIYWSLSAGLGNSADPNDNDTSTVLFGSRGTQ